MQAIVLLRDACNLILLLRGTSIVARGYARKGTSSVGKWGLVPNLYTTWYCMSQPLRAGGRSTPGVLAASHPLNVLHRLPWHANMSPCRLWLGAAGVWVQNQSTNKACGPPSRPSHQDSEGLCDPHVDQKGS